MPNDIPHIRVPIVDSKGQINQEWYEALRELDKRIDAVEIQGQSIPISIPTPTVADAPVGAILPYGGSAAPSGWLLCDGSAVNRVTYMGLFDIIGTAYGAGDGSTTFNLPDGRDRAFFGDGTTLNRGGTGGAATIDIAHTHDVTLPGKEVQSGLGQFVTGIDVPTLTTDSKLSVAQSIMPPYFVGNWIIKY